MAGMLTDESLKIGQNFLENARPGDMIEFNRGVYSHWSIVIYW